MRWILMAAGLLGAASTVMGAMGAHLSMLTDASRQSWQTAVTFGLLHATAAVAVGGWGARLKGSQFIALGLVVGGWMFAGAIWLKYTMGMGGALAPIGGATLIISWTGLVLMAIASNHDQGLDHTT